MDPRTHFIFAAIILLHFDKGNALACLRCRSYEHLSSNCFNTELNNIESVSCGPDAEYCYEMLQLFEFQKENRTNTKFSRGCSYIEKSGKFLVPKEFRDMTHKIIVNTCTFDNCNNDAREELETMFQSDSNATSLIRGNVAIISIAVFVYLIFNN